MNTGFLPLDLVCERDLDILLKFDLDLWGQIDIHDLLAVVADVQFFMRPDEIVLSILIGFSHDTFMIKRFMVIW